MTAAEYGRQAVGATVQRDEPVGRPDTPAIGLEGGGSHG